MARASEFGQLPPEILDVPISFTGQPALTLKVDRNKVTRKWASSADADFYAAITQVVSGWDLVHDDGSPYEMTPDAWLALGLTLQHEMELIEQIVTAAAPSRAEGNELSAQPSMKPMDSTPLAETHPNGPATSESASISTSPSPT